MHDYIAFELPYFLDQIFTVNIEKLAITGFSMGGHGALILHFRNPGKFLSVSAFAPICNPTKCPWS